MVNVSIVVPVFNAEKYIEDCVNSVLAQSFEAFELILVDDGSRDGSGVLCDRYASEYERIHAIHQANGGVTSARRRGVSEAKGEWIMFVDADDKLASDGVSNLVDYAQGDSSLDIVEGGYKWFYPDGTIKDCHNKAQKNNCPIVYDNHDYALSMYLQEGPTRGPWAKIIRKTVLCESGALEIPRWITNREDAMMMTITAKKARRIALLPEYVYLYRCQFGPSAVSNKLSFRYWDEYLHYTKSVVLSDVLPQWNDVWGAIVRNVFFIIAHSGCVTNGSTSVFFMEEMLGQLSTKASDFDIVERWYFAVLRLPHLFRIPLCYLSYMFFHLKRKLLGWYFNKRSRKN